MRKRTFDCELYKDSHWVKIGGKDTLLKYSKSDSIVTYNELPKGKFIKTGRKAYCRGCGRVIGGDVLKLSRSIVKTYGRRGQHMVDFSYCLKCSKILMREEFKKCEDFIKVMTKRFKSVSRADKIYSTKRMKDEELIQQI